ncbi:MAG TPA: glycosyltransferase [Ferruginibacter sp.]|nr:glycosyltransferase [Ferruginibacter sp.]
MQKKIIFLVPNLFYGGASKVITLICNNLCNRRFKILLVAVNGENNFYTQDIAQLNFIDLKKKQVKVAAWAIYRLIKREKPDIVFSNGQDLNILNTFFKKFCFVNKYQLVCRETSVLSGNNNNTKLGNLYNWLVKKLYNNANAIICQSAQMKNDLCRNFKIQSKILQVIPNPVEVLNAVEAEHFNTNAELKLLLIGRLVPEKGFLRILKAMKYLPGNWQLVILGDGPQLNELNKATEKFGITQKIIFAGLVKNTAQYIAGCNFVLSGSYNEGFPNIVLEAGAQGKPVIAFKAPGVGEEVIENGVTGILVNEDDEKIFANAIITAQSINFNPLKIKEKIISRYGISIVIEQYEQLFELLTNNNETPK